MDARPPNRSVRRNKLSYLLYNYFPSYSSILLLHFVIGIGFHLLISDRCSLILFIFLICWCCHPVSFHFQGLNPIIYFINSIQFRFVHRSLHIHHQILNLNLQNGSSWKSLGKRLFIVRYPCNSISDAKFSS